jgi:hypothetical protein
MLWARLLAYVTGTVNQELLLRNEYLAHVDATQGPIRILSVSAIADERAGIKLDDAASRR